jgi:hypothetical protein
MSADEVLASLVQDVEKTGAGCGVSLCLNGLIVSGELIRSERYYDLMSKIFDTGMEITTKDQSDIDKLHAFLDRYRQLMQRMSEHIGHDNPEYIHLENVVIYAFGSALPFVTGLWRGKLSAVDGFTLGVGPHKVKDVTDQHSNQH